MVENFGYPEGDWLSIDSEVGLIYRRRGTIRIERIETEIGAIEDWRLAITA